MLEKGKTPVEFKQPRPAPYGLDMHQELNKLEKRLAKIESWAKEPSNKGLFACPKCKHRNTTAFRTATGNIAAVCDDCLTDFDV